VKNDNDETSRRNRRGRPQGRGSVLREKGEEKLNYKVETFSIWGSVGRKGSRSEVCEWEKAERRVWQGQGRGGPLGDNGRILVWGERSNWEIGARGPASEWESVAARHRKWALRSSHEGPKRSLGKIWQRGGHNMTGAENARGNRPAGQRYAKVGNG